jgi:DNA-binding XRE family transcriptional regulator
MIAMTTAKTAMQRIQYSNGGDTVSIEAESGLSIFALRKHLKAFFARPGAPTQAEVAKLAGITRENLNRIINGRQKPMLDNAAAIALATGTTLSRILRNSEKDRWIRLDNM